MSLKTYTIAEISQITKLAPHTLRYYEQQFPHLLKTERSKGGHRIYNQSHLDILNSIIHLLKDEGMTIKQARQELGEPEIGFEENEISNENKTELVTVDKKLEDHSLFHSVVPDISTLLLLVVEKLDSICRNNKNRDKILMKLLKSKVKKEQLFEQLARTRRENHETLECVRQLLNKDLSIH